MVFFAHFFYLFSIFSWLHLVAFFGILLKWKTYLFSTHPFCFLSIFINCILYRNRFPNFVNLYSLWFKCYNNNRNVQKTVVCCSATQVSYQYYLSLSPADGRLYISDPERHQILRVLSLDAVPDPAGNWEPAVGSGERCIPGDEGNCGDEGPATNAKLAHPKGTLNFYCLQMRRFYVSVTFTTTLYQVMGVLYNTCCITIILNIYFLPFSLF